MCYLDKVTLLVMKAMRGSITIFSRWLTDFSLYLISKKDGCNITTYSTCMTLLFATSAPAVEVTTKNWKITNWTDWKNCF